MKPRRVVAVLLVVLGGALMFFAPGTPGGAVLIGLGIVIEVIGIFLEHRR
jgi:membrane-bound ClpP family serine protease